MASTTSINMTSTINITNDVSDIATPADIHDCTMFRYETDCDGSPTCVCCDCSGHYDGSHYNGHCQCRPKELTGNPIIDRDIHASLVENLHWNIQGLHMYIQSIQEDLEGKYTAEWKEKQIKRLTCDLYWYTLAFNNHRKQLAECVAAIKKLAEEAAAAEESTWTTVARKR